MHGFGLLMLSVAICLERAEGRTATGLLFTASVLLSMITAGSNFVTALQGLLSLLTILFISVVVEHRKKGLWLLPATLVYIIGTGQFRAGPQLCRLGIQSPGVHRQIFSGRSKTSSRVYGIYCSYGNGDAVTPDLAGT